MALTYGFYDAIEDNGEWDREYTASQFSSVFDGLVTDGVYGSIGDCFMVRENSPTANMTVIVGTGRAWFDHTWSLNSDPYPIEIPTAHTALPRIDTVYLYVNTSQRENSIEVMQGVAASSPVPKDLPEGGYPLAYILVHANVTKITTDNIYNAVSSEECPLVTGLVQQMTTDELVEQWQAQWNLWLAANQAEFNTTITGLESDVQTRINYLDTEIEQVEQEVGADLKPIVGYDISVATSAWSTYTPTSGTEEYKVKEKGYTYRATVPLANVIPGMRPYITWSLPDIEDAGVSILNQCECVSGGVKVYADGLPSSSIKVLTLECRKVVTGS